MNEKLCAFEFDVGWNIFSGEGSRRQMVMNGAEGLITVGYIKNTWVFLMFCRFNAAQYGSFLLAGASSSAGRFPGMPTASQCGVKGESSAWGGGRYHHDTLSDLHLADYSAAAAAHYSNMTAGNND